MNYAFAKQIISFGIVRSLIKIYINVTKWTIFYYCKKVGENYIYYSCPRILVPQICPPIFPSSSE